MLAFSVVMLNTDVHNPANKHKMTKEEFVRNNRGIDGDGDLPREMLEAVWRTRWVLLGMRLICLRSL